MSMTNTGITGMYTSSRGLFKGLLIKIEKMPGQKEYEKTVSMISMYLLSPTSYSDF
jgi:hypothetical protein